MVSRARAADMGFLLTLLAEGFERKTWHGPNLKQALRGVSVKEALWRPRCGRHNIWEFAVHAAYWKYVVRRRLLQQPRSSFAIKGSNWFAAPETASEAEWRDARRLLDEEHRRLMETIADRRDARPVKKQVRMVLGVAFHDVYHAGQIRLVRRLYESQRQAKG